MVSGKKQRAAKYGINSLRWIARAILFVWSLLALWFLAGALIYEGWPEGRIHTIQAVVIILAFLIAWWLELIGGALLVLLAIISFVVWGRANTAVALFGCLPLLVTGILFVATWVRARPPLRAQLPPTSPSPPQK